MPPLGEDVNIRRTEEQLLMKNILSLTFVHNQVQFLRLRCREDKKSSVVSKYISFDFGLCVKKNVGRATLDLLN